MAGNSPDKHLEASPLTAKPVLTVTQPEKIGSLLDTLNLIDSMSERLGEDKSGDMGGAGGQAKGTQAGTHVVTPREQAIAHLPSEQVMQTKLAEKIRGEVRDLRHQIRAIPSTSRPGAAFKLNKLYARIRLLNRLLGNLFESSVEVIKRLFIRVFIDEQPIL